MTKKQKCDDDVICEFYNIHGDEYNYKLVHYVNWDTNIDIICHKHGIFQKKYHLHKKGQGCQKCSDINNKKKFIRGFTSKANKKYNNKYNYDLVEYKNSYTKIKIVCPVHGVFEQIPKNHLSGDIGCPDCCNESRHTKLSHNSDIFKNSAIDIHGNKYNYDLVEYKDSKQKIKIVCPDHGVFEQIPNGHLTGQNCPICSRDLSYTSSSELEVRDYLSFVDNIKFNDRSIIEPLELDIYLPDYNLAIEFNGLYWHSEQKGKNKKYHLNKTELCESQGIQLIHIFEDEWINKKDIIKSILSSLLGKSKRICFAKNTIIKEISPQLKNKFLDENHRQGKDRSSVKLGAFFDDELVSVMTFGKPNFTKGSSKGIELNRFCTKKFGFIPGVAGKLLSYFINNPWDLKDESKDLTIFSYADRRYSIGGLYDSLGFDFVGKTPPCFWWLLKNARVHRSIYMKHMMKDKLKHFNPDHTGYQNMLNNGYDRIWDCGNLKYKIFINK